MSLLGQLLWREFYYTAAAHTPNYHQKEDNPICKQIPWDDNPEFFKVSPGLSADLSACLCRKALTCMTRWDTAAAIQIFKKSGRMTSQIHQLLTMPNIVRHVCRRGRTAEQGIHGLMPSCASCMSGAGCIIWRVTVWCALGCSACTYIQTAGYLTKLLVSEH